MKIIEMTCDNYEIHEHQIVLYEKNENHENLRISWEIIENHENLRITYENHIKSIR